MDAVFETGITSGLAVKGALSGVENHYAHSKSVEAQMVRSAEGEYERRVKQLFALNMNNKPIVPLTEENSEAVRTQVANIFDAAIKATVAQQEAIAAIGKKEVDGRRITRYDLNPRLGTLERALDEVKGIRARGINSARDNVREAISIVSIDATKMASESLGFMDAGAVDLLSRLGVRRLLWIDVQGCKARLDRFDAQVDHNREVVKFVEGHADSWRRKDD